MRISDWSSDVCSTVLVFAFALGGLFTLAPASAARSPSSNPAELPQACDVDRDAQSCLKQAIRLYEGKTLPKDDATARRFAAKACAEGAAEGCNFLAAMLEKGIGGPADRQAAVRNYRRACNEGYANELGRASGGARGCQYEWISVVA